ncbi:MAG: RluA family pseudouridine synthase [Clostridia bacterium]|nr:RluA family pseudouridine synthase [Clostridia bacterium]
MKILYDDKYITVCIKPPELLSERSDTGKDIINTLEAHFESAGNNCEIYPLHRLDLGVGGVMVFAKSRDAAAKMSALVSGGGLIKEYLAIVNGKPEKDADTLCDLLFKDSKRNKSFVVDRRRAGVREAKLAYTLLESNILDGDTLSLVKIRLYTGRSHQIRVQFSSRKMPLYGDRKYGAPKGKDIALWSYKLTFTHPFTGKEIKVSALPAGGIWDEFDLTDKQS